MGKNKRNRMRPIPLRPNTFQGPATTPNCFQFVEKPPSNPIYPDPISRDEGAKSGNSAFGTINKPPWQKSRDLASSEWNFKEPTQGWEGRTGLDDNFSKQNDLSNIRNPTNIVQDNFGKVNQPNRPPGGDWTSGSSRRTNDERNQSFSLANRKDVSQRSTWDRPKGLSGQSWGDSFRGPSRPNWDDGPKSSSTLDWIDGLRGSSKSDWDNGPRGSSGINWNDDPQGLRRSNWDDGPRGSWDKNPTDPQRLNWEDDPRGCPPVPNWDNEIQRGMLWNDRPTGPSESNWNNAGRDPLGLNWRDGSGMSLEDSRGNQNMLHEDMWMHRQEGPDRFRNFDSGWRDRNPLSKTEDNKPPSLLNEDFMNRLREIEGERAVTRFREQWDKSPQSRKRLRTPDRDVWSRLEVPGKWNTDQQSKRARIPDRRINKLEELFPSSREMEARFLRPDQSSINDLRAKLVRRDKPFRMEDQNAVKEVIIAPRYNKQKFNAKDLEFIKDALIKKLYEFANNEDIENVPQLRFTGINLITKKRIIVTCYDDVTVNWLLNWYPIGLRVKIRQFLPEDPTTLTVIGFIIKGLYKGDSDSLKNALKTQNAGLDVGGWRNGLVKLTKRGQAYSFLVDGHTIRYLIDSKWELFFEMQKLFVRRIKSNG